MFVRIIFFCFLLVIPLGTTPRLIAQEEPEAPAATPDDSAATVEEKVRHLLSKYESEVSFLLPEGEFDAMLEKKIGHFATQARARYNFVRGEMGFSLQNNYNRFRVVPQTQVYDRLHFVPVFEANRADRVWRREQGLQFAARIFFFRPINALTGFNYQRYSFPSTVNQKVLSSQEVHSLSQAVGVQADSARFLGFYNSGTLDLAIVRAFPNGRHHAQFWQLQLLTRGIAEARWLAIIGEVRLVSMLDQGEGVPLSFLGGRNRLSAYDANEFSGVNLFYLSGSNRFHLNKEKAVDLAGGFSLFETNLIVHTEAGQIGLNEQVRNLANYHVSLGAGFNSIVAYRQRRACEFFFYTYKALEPRRNLRYYFGVKF